MTVQVEPEYASNRGSYGGNKIAEASDVRSRFRRSSECTGRNESERRASLEKVIAQADRTTLSGKADTVGETGEEYP